MIKLLCDVCKKDANVQDEFLFEGTIVEMVAGVDGVKRQKRTVVHICKDCYDKKLKEIIYGKS